MTTTESEVATPVFGLADLLRVLRSRWRWVVGSVLVVVGLTLAFSVSQSAQYTASATVLLQNDAENLLGEQISDQIPAVRDRELLNQLEVITSIGMQRRVAKVYDGDLNVGDVFANAGSVGSDVLAISASGGDPDEAAKLANLYAQQYVEYRRSQRIDAVVETSEQIQVRLDEVEDDRAALIAPLNEIEARLAAQPNNAALRAQRDQIESNSSAEAKALDQQVETYQTLLENLQLQVGLPGALPAQIIDEATPPTEQTSPKPVRDAVIGLMLGLLVGVVLAFAREFLDESIRTTLDLERVIQHRVPTLGVIPDATELEVNGLARTTSHSALAEAFRALRTSVKFSELDKSMRVIQVTSGSQGEGKTTTAANLAVMLTQAGHRVAIACCDLRRPQIHERFREPLGPGFADVVLGDASLAEAVRSVGANDLLFLLPAGTSPPNPSELLGSGRAESVISALADEMDYVIIDSTPVLPVTDALVVSRFVDATIVVVASGNTSRHELTRTLDSLEQVAAPTIGVVLNRASLGDRNAYGYTYGKSGYTSTGGGYSSLRTPMSGRRRGAAETASPFERDDAGLTAHR